MWNVNATMVTLPVGPNGAYTFGGDQFPIEVSTMVWSNDVRDFVPGPVKCFAR